MPASDDLGPLFRREAGKMTSALTRVFGLHNLPLVEDVVHDALCRALETWKFSGVPDNPAAWLMAAARNRAVDVLRRERTARSFAPELEHVIKTEWSLVPAVREAFSDEAVRDEQLRMMFACCHARLPEETQVALILNLLGGFGVKEIAAAFLTAPATMEKRIQRGKQVLAEAKGLLEVTQERVAERLGAVHAALYLLFNEGYHGSQTETVRAEVCAEAIHLGSLLLESPLTATPATHALLALMCLVAARLPGRLDAEGELVALGAQDRSAWDAALVQKGIAALEASTFGDELTAFHIEAAIAYEHTVAESDTKTNWLRIVELYDRLLGLRPTPVVALNRAIAIGEVEGPERALEELGRIEGRERLAQYPFYEAAQAEQHLRAGRKEQARAHFEAAAALARNPGEARFLAKRIAATEK